MNDLNTLLDRAAGSAVSPTDVHADLTRGHRALARTRRRRGAAGLIGVAAAGVLGVGAVRLVQPGDVTAPRAVEIPTPKADASEPPAGGITFLAQPFEAGPYTFDSTPEGWEVQGFRASTVTIAPVGFPDRHPDSFEGKLVIMLESYPPSGEKIEHEGRTFWVIPDSGGGYTRLTTRTLPGEPEGSLEVQFPIDTGWERETMLDFLAGVQVNEGAVPSGGGAVASGPVPKGTVSPEEEPAASSRG